MSTALDTRDPAYVGFTGTLIAEVAIGDGGAPVGVTAKVDDDDVGEIEATYQGIDITPLLCVKTTAQIVRGLENNWDSLVRKAREVRP